MLYVKRIAEVGKVNWWTVRFEVVDTATGSSKLYTSTELDYFMADNPGLEIKGVDWSRVSNGIDSIVPYQLQEYSSGKLAKLQTVEKVGMCLSDGVIEGVFDFGTQGCTIRLSDYGSFCDTCVFYSMLFGKHPITIILDDKVSLSDCALYGVARINGLRLDVREVTNQHSLELVYNPHLDTVTERINYYRDVLIDNPERHDQNILEFVFGDRIHSRYAYKELKSCFMDFDKSLALATDYLSDDFRRLCSHRVSFENVDSDTYMSLRRLYHSVDLWKQQVIAGECTGIDHAETRHVNISYILRSTDNVDMRVYKLFYAYVIYLGGTEELRQLFGKFILDMFDEFLNAFGKH